MFCFVLLLSMIIAVSQAIVVAPVKTEAQRALVQSARSSQAVGFGCTGCVDFFTEFTGILIKAALQFGVLGSCSEICSYVPTSLGKAFCDLACIGLGFDEFIHILNTADLDPLYVCAELDICARSSCSSPACTDIQTVSVYPASAPVRTKFEFDVAVRAKYKTGTGLTVVVIKCPSCNQQGEIELATVNEGFAGGSLNHVNVTLDTAEEDWLYAPGTYPFEALSCKFGCSDEYGAIWSKKFGSFVITA